MILKKKITFGLLPVLLLAGLYIGLRFTFGLFTPVNFWTARQDIKNGNIRFAQPGKLPLNFIDRENLAKSYGFSLFYPENPVSADAKNGIKYYNQVMIAHLENKYGKGFWKNFQAKLDSIDISQNQDVTVEKVINLVCSLEIVKNQIRLVDSLSKSQRQISLLPFLEDSLKNIYSVKVAEDNGTNYVTYFNFLVDANAMKVLNPDGK